MAEADRYWLSVWLDDARVGSTERAEQLLSQGGVASELRARARAAQVALARPAVGTAIFAGSGLDLFCRNPLCQRRKVDSLLRRILHYFDAVVVEEYLADTLANGSGALNDRERDVVLSQINLLAYLRLVGAEDCVQFRSVGALIPVNDTDLHRPYWREIRRVVREAEFHQSRWSDEGTITFGVYHPAFGNPLYLTLDLVVPMYVEDRETRLHIANLFVAEKFASFLRDAALSRTLGVPLGLSVECQATWMRDKRSLSADQYAFNLRLPIFEGMRIPELARLRSENRASFELFRAKLRAALTEAAASGEPVSDELAKDIASRVIEPGVQRIEADFRDFRERLVSKAAVSVGTGSLATICGIVAHAPYPATAMAAIGTATTLLGGAVMRHIDDVHELRRQEMYFAWKVRRHVTS